MQLGPLAELLVAADPLATDLAAHYGVSATYAARPLDPRRAAALTLMRGWLDELERALGEPLLEPPKPGDIDDDADGFGVTNATEAP